MADLTFTATMGDSGVGAGLDRFEQQAVKAAHKSNAAFGVLEHGTNHMLTGMVKGIAGALGLHQALGLATDAIAAYAKVNMEAAQAVDRLSETREHLLADLGRDLMFLVQPVEAVLHKLGEWRDWAVNATTIGLKMLDHGGDSPLLGSTASRFKMAKNEAAAYEQQMRIAAEKEKEFADAAMLSNKALETQEKIMRLSGQTLEADTIAARIEYQKTMKEIADQSKEKKLSPQTTQSLRDLAASIRDASIEKAQADDDKRWQDDFDKRMKERDGADKERRAAEDKRSDATFEFQIARDEAKLAVDKLHMTKQQIDLKEREIKLAEELARINKIDGLTSSEKAILASDARIAAAADLVGDLKDKIKSPRRFDTAINPGAMSIGLGLTGAQPVYSATTVPGLREAQQQLEEAKKASRLLINIEKSVAVTARNSGGAARFAP